MALAASLTNIRGDTVWAPSGIGFTLAFIFIFSSSDQKLSVVIIYVFASISHCPSASLDSPIVRCATRKLQSRGHFAGRAGRRFPVHTSSWSTPQQSNHRLEFRSWETPV